MVQGEHIASVRISLVRGAFDDPAMQELVAKDFQYPAPIHIKWSFSAVCSLTQILVAPPHHIQQPTIWSEYRTYGHGTVLKLDALNHGKEDTVTWNPVDVAVDKPS
ncbi:hypothetical protein C8R48DRAFT_773785 [Suillus tomentosus]|nr:hypothetical protein C8R48DRAFT_773785 [Suillus tomentosus]